MGGGESRSPTCTLYWVCLKVVPLVVFSVISPTHNNGKPLLTDYRTLRSRSFCGPTVFTRTRDPLAYAASLHNVYSILRFFSERGSNKWKSLVANSNQSFYLRSSCWLPRFVDVFVKRVLGRRTYSGTSEHAVSSLYNADFISHFKRARNFLAHKHNIFVLSICECSYLKRTNENFTASGRFECTWDAASSVHTANEFDEHFFHPFKSASYTYQQLGAMRWTEDQTICVISLNTDHVCWPKLIDLQLCIHLFFFITDR